MTDSLRKSPGWLLLPLRLFLGITFVFAGLQKLANPAFFNSSNPASIQAQISAYQARSPIHVLLSIASHAPVLFGLLIALGELGVGIGILLGIFSRLSALVGLAISVILFLGVSFHSNPYYTGSDIVFIFAWTPLLILGNGGVASVEEIVKRRLGMVEAYSAVVGIDFATITRVCGQFEAGRCRAQGRAICSVATCPVLIGDLVLGNPRGASGSQVPIYDPERRRFLVRAGTVGVAGGVAVALGTVSAGVGRVLYKAPKSSNSSATLAKSTASSSSSATPTTTSASASGPTTTSSVAQGVANPKGTAVGPASAVPVGKVASFVDPASGSPAYVLHPTTSKFVAFSAICPHAGCTVQYASGNLFVCPCHGSQFDATTGAVLQGPAASGLPSISVVEGTNGQLYVDG